MTHTIHERARMVLSATTIAQVLKTAGYTTGTVGKWHLGVGEGGNDWNQEVRPNPADLGFDHHFLMPATGDVFFTWPSAMGYLTATWPRWCLFC